MTKSLVALTALVLAAAVSAMAQSTPAITVGPNVQVSRMAGTDPHLETVAGAHPTDPKRLIACAMVDIRHPDGGRVAAFVSTDGGATWTRTLETPRTAFDPDCEFGPDGAAYVLSDFQTDSLGIKLWRSPDGGRTWGAPTTIPAGHSDRPWLAIDRSRGKGRGTIYLSYVTIARGIEGPPSVASLVLVTSPDSGRTFGSPAARSFVGRGVCNFVVNKPVVLPDASMLGVVSQRFRTPREGRLEYGCGWDVMADRENPKPTGELLVVRAIDGGRVIQPGLRIGDEYAAESPGTYVPGSVAVDQSDGPFHGRIYTAWTDFRSGRGDILLAFSSDSGRTWSRPRAINDDRPAGELEAGPDDFMPTLAVSPTGVVGVMWYDRRNIPDNLGYEVRFSASLDGGETWLPSVKVSERPNTFERGESIEVQASVDSIRAPGVRLSVSDATWITGGHTSGLAVRADGVFHPVWVDNRTGIQQVWTAAVAVRGAVAKHGAPELARLDDVSAKLSVVLANRRFDRASGRLTVDAYLKNTSRDTIRGPVIARLTSIRSELAGVTVLDSDPAPAGIPANWRFAPRRRDGLLAPGDSTTVRTLAFQLSDIRTRRRGRLIRSSLLDIDLQLLGAMQTTGRDAPVSAKPAASPGAGAGAGSRQ